MKSDKMKKQLAFPQRHWKSEDKALAYSKWRRKACWPRDLYPGKWAFKDEGGRKTIPDIKKQRTCRPQAWITRNAKGRASGERELTWDGHFTQEEMKSSGNGKHAGGDTDTFLPRISFKDVWLFKANSYNTGPIINIDVVYMATEHKRGTEMGPY